MTTATPYVCPACRDTEAYYGRLVFPAELPPTDDQFNAVAEHGGAISTPEPPRCPNHKRPVLLVPVQQKENQ